MDQWTPEEVEAHFQFMSDFATRLQAPASSSTPRRCHPTALWVRSDGEGRPPVTDGPFAETKDLIAGWMVIDVDSHERALELAGELSAAPGAGGEPIHEWLEVRPFLDARRPTVTRRDAVDEVDAARARPAGPRASSSAAVPTSRRPRTRCRRRSSGPCRAWQHGCARRPQRLADHRRMADVPRLVRSEPARADREVRGRRRAADRGGAEHRRHAAPLLPVRAPRR